MKKIVNPTIVHSATQPSERADLWIKALPNNQNTLMIFDNGYENVDSNLTERLDNEAQERQSSDEELNNKINQETTNRVNADNNLSNRINTNLNSINNINSKIPAQASSTNQLADKNFVNSSIANDAATFQGTFETVNDLPTTNVKKNDYAFIVSVTSEGNPEYKRYKYNGTQWLEEFVLNNSSFTANQWASINSGVTENWINETTETLKSVTGSTIEITWSDLKAKRDAGELTPSQFYRITDYQCTTVQSNTRSAGNQFDIIVLALTNNTLSEQAWAALHSGDTYFANSNLSAWKLWYCLDNDTTRFAWADSTNGKGVIYRMIDEFNNDVPYDFKNIQCIDWSVPSGSYYYTFYNNSGSVSDPLSSHNNIIKKLINNGLQEINRIIFFSKGIVGTTIEENCRDINIDESYSLIKGNSHNINIIGGDNIIIGNNCYNIISDVYTSRCIISDNCHDITLKRDTGYYIKDLIIGIGCEYLRLRATSLDDSKTGGYRILNCVKGTSSGNPLIIDLENRTYETKVGLNSNGELKQWCEADLVQ